MPKTYQMIVASTATLFHVGCAPPCAHEYAEFWAYLFEALTLDGGGAEEDAWAMGERETWSSGEVEVTELEGGLDVSVSGIYLRGSALGEFTLYESPKSLDCDGAEPLPEVYDIIVGYDEGDTGTVERDDLLDGYISLDGEEMRISYRDPEDRLVLATFVLVHDDTAAR